MPDVPVEETPPAPPQRHLIVLGSGTSTGVPLLGCDCDVCTSDDPRNQRTRPSALFRLPGGDVLVDTSPEMRLQLLRERVGYVNAVLYTHYHADHLFGLDDARLFPKRLGGPVPIYCEEAVEQVVRRAFSYAFREVPPGTADPGFVPQLVFRRIAPGDPFELLGERFTPIRLDHGRFEVLGFRVGGLAYCTDVSRIPESSWPLLEGLDVLLLDALRYDPHPTHFNLEQAIQVVDRLKPRQTFFTHISHQLDHERVERDLPPQIRLAYDGLRIDF